jgi:hypothetical protein
MTISSVQLKALHSDDAAPKGRIIACLPRYFVEQQRVELGRAFRADAVSKFRFRVFSDVNLNIMPISFIVAYLLAIGANRQNAAQFPDRTQGILELRNEACPLRKRDPQSGEQQCYNDKENAVHGHIPKLVVGLIPVLLGHCVRIQCRYKRQDREDNAGFYSDKPGNIGDRQKVEYFQSKFSTGRMVQESYRQRKQHANGYMVSHRQPVQAFKRVHLIPQAVLLMA